MTPAPVVPMAELDDPATIRHDYEPEYPRDVADHHQQGTVRLEFTILPTGQVEPCSIQVLSGPPVAFVEAAKDALRRTRFVPAQKDGRAVASRMQRSYWFGPR